MSLYLEAAQVTRHEKTRREDRGHGARWAHSLVSKYITLSYGVLVISSISLGCRRDHGQAVGDRRGWVSGGGG